MTPDVDDVLASVKDRLEPSDDHDAHAITDDVQAALTEADIDAALQLGGSVAKGTHVGDDYDVDIFVKYPRSRRGDPISDDLETALNHTGYDYRRVQASRDFYIVDHDGREYELVPVLDIDDPGQAETVIDVSPLHVAYFNDNADQSQRPHVRLLKQFMKAHHVYGAESYISGFSGHVVDLLVLAYQDFTGVLKAATQWQPKTVIDLEEHHRTPMLTLNESKTHGPLILVDPIQPQRNAAAAVDQDTYDAFRDAAKTFLNQPSRDAFHIPGLDERIHDAQDEAPPTHSVHDVTVRFDDARHDKNGAQLQKIREHLVRELRDANFDVHDSFIHHDDESHIVITASTKPKTETHRITGPPVDLADHADAFKQAHDDVEEHEGRLIAHEPNPYETSKDALQEIISDDYVTKRSLSAVYDEEETHS